jgi:hypothetical protein
MDSKSYRPVDCKGPNSVFSAILSCMPMIARTNDCSRSRGAFSEIELCKYLTKSGYTPYRVRSRVKGTTDKWTKGINRWKGRRWIDPRSPGDLDHLRSRLDTLRLLCTSSPNFDRKILCFISNLADAKQLKEEGEKEVDTSTEVALCWEHQVPRGFTTMQRRWPPNASKCVHLSSHTHESSSYPLSLRFRASLFRAAPIPTRCYPARLSSGQAHSALTAAAMAAAAGSGSPRPGRRSVPSPPPPWRCRAARTGRARCATRSGSWATRAAPSSTSSGEDD